MDAHLGRRRLEDQPSTAAVDRTPAQHLAQERPSRVGVVRVEDRVDPVDHGVERTPVESNVRWTSASRLQPNTNSRPGRSGASRTSRTRRPLSDVHPCSPARARTKARSDMYAVAPAETRTRRGSASTGPTHPP